MGRASRLFRAHTWIRDGNKQNGLQYISDCEYTHTLSEVVGQCEVACERVGERVIHVEHLQQIITLDDVQVAVGQSAHVGRRLTDCCLIAELVTEHVSLAYTRSQYSHLLNFSASSHKAKSRPHWRL